MREADNRRVIFAPLLQIDDTGGHATSSNKPTWPLADPTQLGEHHNVSMA